MRALEGKRIDTKTYMTMEKKLPSDHKSDEPKNRHAVIPSMKRRMKDKSMTGVAMGYSSNMDIMIRCSCIRISYKYGGTISPTIPDAC